MGWVKQGANATSSRPDGHAGASLHGRLFSVSVLPPYGTPESCRFWVRGGVWVRNRVTTLQDIIYLGPQVIQKLKCNSSLSNSCHKLKRGGSRENMLNQIFGSWLKPRSTICRIVKSSLPVSTSAVCFLDTVRVDSVASRDSLEEINWRRSSAFSFREIAVNPLASGVKTLPYEQFVFLNHQSWRFPFHNRAISGNFAGSTWAMRRESRACSLRCVLLLTTSASGGGFAGTSSSATSPVSSSSFTSRSTLTAATSAFTSALTPGSVSRAGCFLGLGIAKAAGFTPDPPRGFEPAGLPISAASFSVGSPPGDNKPGNCDAKPCMASRIDGSCTNCCMVLRQARSWSHFSAESSTAAAEADGPNLIECAANENITNAIGASRCTHHEIKNQKAQSKQKDNRQDTRSRFQGWLQTLCWRGKLDEKLPADPEQGSHKTSNSRGHIFRRKRRCSSTSMFPVQSKGVIGNLQNEPRDSKLFKWPPDGVPISASVDYCWGRSFQIDLKSCFWWF